MTQHPAPASPGAPDLDAFGRELHRRMQGTGYEVVREGDSVVARANLADRSWWVFAQRSHLTEVWETRLTPRRPGVLDMDDRRRSLEWSAGIPTLGSLSKRIDSGWSVGTKRRIEVHDAGRPLAHRSSARLPLIGWPFFLRSLAVRSSAGGIPPADERTASGSRPRPADVASLRGAIRTPWRARRAAARREPVPRAPRECEASASPSGRPPSRGRGSPIRGASRP
ncbi:hypothetical protein USB125703_00455 [Pseudoclavibacter triregionum]|nr:hypothetical protein USB125703_00455 [Pseudoclavibacter triregionum]